MRIVENTPARLVLRDRTLRLSWIFFAIAAASAVWFAIRGGDPWQLIVCALWIGFGLVFLRATDVTLDKPRRVCTVRRRDIWRVTARDLAFAEITDVRVEPMPGDDDDAGGVACRLSLVIGPETAPLTATYQPSLERFEAMREVVLDALFGERARPAGEDPVEVLVKAGRGIDAIALLRRRDGLGLAEAHSRVAAMRKRLQT
jgi:hypothetical protein